MSSIGSNPNNPNSGLDISQPIISPPTVPADSGQSQGIGAPQDPSSGGQPPVQGPSPKSPQVQIPETQQRVERLAQSLQSLTSSTFTSVEISKMRPKITGNPLGSDDNLLKYTGLLDQHAHVNRSMSALQSLSASDLKSVQTDGTDRGSVAITNAISAQNALKASLAGYAKATGQDLTAEINACDNKVAELLKIVAGVQSMDDTELASLDTLLQANRKDSAGPSIPINLDTDTSAKQAEKLQRQLNELFVEMEQLRGQEDKMPAEEFQGKVANLQKKIQDCQGSLAELTGAKASGTVEPNLQTDDLPTDGITKEEQAQILQSQLDDLFVQMASLESDDNTLSIDDLSAKVMELTDKIRECRASLEALTLEIAPATEPKSAEHAEQTQPFDQEEQAQILQTQLDDLFAELASLEHNDENLSEENLTAKIAEVNGKIQECRTSLEELSSLPKDGEVYEPAVDSLDSSEQIEQIDEIKQPEQAGGTEQTDQSEQTGGTKQTEQIDQTNQTQTTDSDIQADLDAELEKELDALVNNPNIFSPPTVSLDKENLEGIKNLLDAAESRLNSLLELNPRKVFQDSVSELLTVNQFPSSEQLEQLGGLDFLGEQKPALTTLMQNANELKTILEQDPVSKEDLQTAASNFAQNFSEHAQDFGDINLICRTINLSESSEQVTQILTSTLGEEKFAELSSLIEGLQELKTSNPTLLKSIEDISSRTLQKEIDNNVQMLERADSRFHATGEYIFAAFTGSTSLDVLVEAKVRGIQPSQITQEAVDSKLEMSRMLNEGLPNEFTFCTYGLDNGEKASFIFKSEHTVRKELDSGPGVKREFNYNAVFASSSILSQIGCESAIMQSKVGTLNGQFGLFTQNSPGPSMKRLLTDQPLLGAQKDLALKDLPASLTPDQKKTFGASLLRELTNLEWSDALLGQTDRHSGNYYFSFNPDSGEAKIAASLGKALTGQIVGLGKIQTRENTETKIIDLTDPEINPQEMRDQTGISQMTKPMFITQEIYDKLMDMDEDLYRLSLEDNLRGSALDAAVSRLQDAKEHAKALFEQGLCFSESSLNSPEVFAKVSEQLTNPPTHSLQQNLLIRDFGSIAAQIYN